MPTGGPFGKADIVLHLAKCYRYRRYLEIATSSTGFFYASVAKGRFDDCRRLMYRCPAEFDDGLAVDYRSPDLDIGAALAAIQAERRRFDIVLVDPFHGYRESSRDLAAAFALLEDGGALVVHDCLPPNEAIACPEFKQGAWCGVTYKAFLDFVLPRRDLRYLTVDTDFGCGVIRKLKSRLPGPFDPSEILRWREARERRRLIAAWRALGDDYAAAWRLFEPNRDELLNLISVEAFRDGLTAID
jgi:hypothetical protein